MSVDARKGMIAAALAAAVGVGCWWLLRSETDGGRSDVRPRLEKPTTDAATPDVRAPRHREKAEADAPSTDESAAPEPPPKPERLTIRVLSAADDAPIVGANVDVEDYVGDEKRKQTATTDAAGAAGVMTFPRVDGPDVSASAQGFVRSGWRRTPFGKETGDDQIVVRLAPATSLDGVIVDAKTGAAIRGVRVTAESSDAGGMHCFGTPDPHYAVVVTGADGAFRLVGVPTAGPTRVSADADGYVADSVEWDGDLSRRIEFRLAPTPPGVIRGVLRDAAGAPVKGMLVRARPMDDVSSDDAHTKDDGAYEITGLRVDRTYDVWADDLDAKPPVATAVTHDVRLTADASTAVRDLALVRAAELTLHVRDKNGRPVATADPVVRTMSALWHPKLDAVGDATVVLARPGAWRIEITAAGFVPHTEEIEIAAGEKRAETFVLDLGASISGVVVDDLGAPLADVLVRADPTDTALSDVMTRTGADGAFHMTGCIASTPYRVTAQDDDASEVATSAPKDDLRLTTARRGAVTFRPKAPPGTSVRLSFATADGKTSFSTSREWYGDPLEPLEVPAATYDVVFSVPEFAPVSHRVVLAPGATVDLGEIVFDRGVGLSGRVVDGEGRPLADARVEANVGGESEGHVAWTDATGAFRVFRLPVGALTLGVAAEGCVGRRVPATAAADAPPLVVTLLRAGGVKGRVVDPPRRHELGDLTVRAFHRTAGGLDSDLVEIPVRKDGAFAARLAPGSWKLDVHGGTNVALGTKDVVVREGDETSVELVLDK